MTKPRLPKQRKWSKAGSIWCCLPEILDRIWEHEAVQWVWGEKMCRDSFHSKESWVWISRPSVTAKTQERGDKRAHERRRSRQMLGERGVWLDTHQRDGTVPILTAVENWLCCAYLLQSFQRPLFVVLHCIALAWTHNLHNAMWDGFCAVSKLS